MGGVISNPLGRFYRMSCDGEVAGVVNYIYCRPGCRGDPANWFSPFIPATLAVAPVQRIQGPNY